MTDERMSFTAAVAIVLTTIRGLPDRSLAKEDLKSVIRDDRAYANDRLADRVFRLLVLDHDYVKSEAKLVFDALSVIAINQP